MKKSIAAEPGKPATYLELAKLQEERNAIDEAEATLTAARAALPSNTAVLTAVAQFYNRRGDFQRTIDALEQIAALDPSDPARHQTVAVFYWEKTIKDKSLSPGDKLAYIQSGIAATDRAIALNADYVEALVYKNILLRMQAQVETDPTRQQQLMAEADTLRNQAIQLQQNRVRERHAATSSTTAATGRRLADARPVSTGRRPCASAAISRPRPRSETSVRSIRRKRWRRRSRASSSSKPPSTPTGHVGDARVLRSIPLLDQAALDAVKQWEFTPTQRERCAVPVIMTVTVNFTLQ